MAAIAGPTQETAGALQNVKRTLPRFLLKRIKFAKQAGSVQEHPKDFVQLNMQKVSYESKRS